MDEIDKLRLERPLQVTLHDVHISYSTFKCVVCCAASKLPHQSLCS